jgi:hypothetical protein
MLHRPFDRQKQHHELEQGWKGLPLFFPPNCVKPKGFLEKSGWS